MYDLPSILNTLLQKTYDMHKHEELDEESRVEYMNYELNHFNQKLFRLIQRTGLQDYIELIILNNEENNAEDVWALMQDAFDNINQRS